MSDPATYHGTRRRASKRHRARGGRAPRDRGDLVWRRLARWKDAPVSRAMLIFDTTSTNSSDPFGSFKDFFHSGTWDLLKNLSFFFLVVFYLASAYWVYKDARRRIEDPWLIAVAVALGLFPPFVGPLVYVFFRPPEYLEDVRERELEIKAMEESLGAERCPVCRASVDST